MKRRRLLGGISTLVSGISGCSGLSPDSSMLDLVFVNHSETPYTVEVRLFRGDGSSRSGAREFSGSIDVEAEGETSRTHVAEAQPYLIEYSLYENDSRLTDQSHVHYYPPGDGGDDTQTFDIDSAGVLTRR
jgi:hypothetical protein